ncbi:Solute carrier family 12 member 6, partial [Trichinella pseudospiralis]
YFGYAIIQIDQHCREQKSSLFSICPFIYPARPEVVSQRRFKLLTTSSVGGYCQELNWFDFITATLAQSGTLETSCTFLMLIREDFIHSGGKIQVKRGLALYEDDTSTDMPTMSTFLKTFSGFATESDDKACKIFFLKFASTSLMLCIFNLQKAKLGTIFGVYLPSIQHILGVQMFLRLLWIVGIAGIAQSFVMVFLCCLCTFLTSISISAIATNGKVKSGGAYFMISRNLGAEFGGAIGVLYYLANTVATSMYLAGGVEILLIYMAPDLPRFGHTDSPNDEQMFNNLRIYGTAFLLLIFVVCCFGVRFVQFAAPVSLACVLLSVLVVYLGAFLSDSSSSLQVCMAGSHLFDPQFLMDENRTVVCNQTKIVNSYCVIKNSTNERICDSYYVDHDAAFVAGFPGFNGQTFLENWKSHYMRKGEASIGHKGQLNREVTQDITTTFFVLLAIFFPSVTGIMTGANMSGDLKDPQKSIPIGTIAATLTTSFIYLSFVVIYGGSINGYVLRDKYGVSLGGKMTAAMLAWPTEWIVLIGSFTSCIGASLQCLCTAPRLLQSIAMDNLIPFLNPFSKVAKNNEPFRALIVTVLIAETAILIGGIDYIAPVVDLFFLLSYCFVNIACALQTLLKAPNWRPRFRFYHWSLAVLGALLNLFIMFSTYWHYAIAALAICGIVYKYIEYKGAKKEWGDGLRGLALSTAQYSLLQIEDSEQKQTDWRPQLLVLVNLEAYQDVQNNKLMHFANQLKKGRGLTIVAAVMNGNLLHEKDRKAAELLKASMKEAMKAAKVKGFTEVVISAYIPRNIDTVLQCVGMASLRPNTVVIGWPENWYSNGRNDTEYYNFFEAVCKACSAEKCVLIPKGLLMFPEIGDQISGTIDIWWIIHDGGLLIFISYLLTQHRVWRSCKIRLFAIAHYYDNSAKLKEELKKWLYHQRIDAEVEVVEISKCIVSENNQKAAKSLNNSQFLNQAADLESEVNEIVKPEKNGKVIFSNDSYVSDENQENVEDENAEPEWFAYDYVDEKSTTTSSSVEKTLPVQHNKEDNSSSSADDSRLLKSNVRKLKMAVQLNKLMREKSSACRLLVINLPKPPKSKDGIQKYMEHLQVLTEGFIRVLFVRGSGEELVTACT